MKRILFLLLINMLCSQLWAQYNPDNPDDPSGYSLTLIPSPENCGTTSPSGTTMHKPGSVVRCVAQPYQGFKFVEWTSGGSVVSKEQVLDFEMPEKDVVLQAVFEWNPDGPGDPDKRGYSHKIIITASPSVAGYFKDSIMYVVEGDTAIVQAYANKGYTFESWQRNGETISTENPLRIVMKTENVNLTAVYKYSPDDPGDPLPQEITDSVPAPIIERSGNVILMRVSLEDAVIHYTMNGDAPDSTSAVFRDSLVVTGNCTIKAIATHSLLRASKVTTFEVNWFHGEPEPYAVLSENNTKLTFFYDDQKEARGGLSVGPFTYSHDIVNSGWYEQRDNITSVEFDESFANCTSLTSTAYWFYECRNLTTIIDIGNLKTDNVTDMRAMFSRCSSLTILNLSGFNTGNVTNMSTMFSRCSNLTSLNVSGFNTANVINMSHMFSYCSNLTSLDVSKFKTDNVTDMECMFIGCSSLTSLDVSGFNTANVTSMSFMFAGCSSLTSLDVRGFNTANVTSIGSMFYGCSGLKTIYAGSEWTTNAVTNGNDMFLNCTSLVGGAGTPYDESHTDYTYAHIDGGENNPGYFTDKNAPEGEATFDGLVARVSGERTLDEAFEQRGGRTEAAKTIAAIVWNKETALTNSDLQGIKNPNLLVYVNEARLAPSNVQNVVVNGMAREIVLTDVQDGNNNWYAPLAFVAERISYTRNFTQSTTKGTSRGWESIALPFRVQTIQHETKGVIAPFNNSASNKHFWLRRLGDNGLQAATGIEANTPYVISMPNSEEYTDDYNLNGRVTFSAQNVDVPATVTNTLALADSSIVMVPAMQRKERSSSVWALNVGEVRGSYFEGSVFERDYREVRPFEAYTVHRLENGQPAPRYVPLMDIGGTTGIETINLEPLTVNQWYDLEGRKLQGKPTQKGIYISNGKKVVVK